MSNLERVVPSMIAEQIQSEIEPVKQDVIQSVNQILEDSIGQYVHD